MRAYDIILKKRDGKKLTKEEIKFLIDNFVSGEISDYQITAWAMAVYFSGLDVEETSHLTEAMVKSGEEIDLSLIHGIKVDKHSTGGVGDKTTLVLVPLVASCGVPVAKMSGRGLGHTGGTLDKLEAIPGYNVNLDKERFIDIVNKTGCAVVGQTGNLVPADKKLYALRDVTATVDNISLIASSVMSKKIAAGSDKILLDVKYGNGAFIKSAREAYELAEIMAGIGKQVGRETKAVISSMEQPLGKTIGNSLEVREAVETLKGEGPQDLIELCLELGSRMLLLGEMVSSLQEGKSRIKEALDTGKGFEKFREMIKSQEGDDSILDNLNKLPQSPCKISAVSSQKGFVHEIFAEQMGLIAMELGAGRKKKDEKIDYGVGIELKKKIGDEVYPGDVLAEVYCNEEESGLHAVQKIKEAFTVLPQRQEKISLVYGDI